MFRLFTDQGHNLAENILETKTLLWLEFLSCVKTLLYVTEREKTHNPVYPRKVDQHHRIDLHQLLVLLLTLDLDQHST